MITKRPLTSREKKIFVVCLALALAYGLKAWIYVPVSTGMKELDIATEARHMQLANNASVVREADEVNRQYRTLVSTFQGRESEGAEISAIISEIEAAGKEAEIHIVNMQPQKAVDKEFYKQYSVRLTIDGEWTAIVQFLYILQNAPGLFDVQELHLENYSRAADKLKGRVTLGRVRLTSP